MMNKKEEQVVTYETAILAKEKGFDWGTLKAYDAIPMLCSHSKSIFEPLNYNSELGGHYCSAPTQSFLQKWLREEKYIDIFVIDSIKENHYDWEIRLEDDEPKIECDQAYTQYEEALEDGLVKALNLIN